LSTHSISVNEVIELARVLKRLPRGLIVYGIEGKSFSAGIDLTPEVRQGANKIIERIVVDIDSLTRHKVTGGDNA
jgi:hydrogenase maturation protease